MDGNIASGLGTFIVGALIFCFLFFVLLIYNVTTWVSHPKKVIESKTLIVPEIKLHTNGKKIDTIFVYREK